MEYTDILEYSDKYLKYLAPFKDNSVYQSIVSLLRNHYFQHAYEDIPSALKQYTEDQTISNDLFDVLLLGAGYPSDLVNNLRFTQKRAIIESLMDFPKYAGSLKYVESLCTVMQEDFNIFELYADFRVVLDESGSATRDWVMVPSAIFKVNDREVYTYEYDEIYNETPTYYVSKEHLEMMRCSGSISLPFKTNLIVLDMQTNIIDGEIEQLTSTTALHYFKEYYFTLYTDSSEYEITIGDAYRLWYYVIYRHHGKIYTPNLAATELIYFNIGNSTYPYTLDPSAPNSIETLIQEYEDLPMEREAITNFYNTYLSNEFKRPVTTDDYSLDEYRKRLMVALGDSLVKDIEATMGGADDKIDGTIAALGLIQDSLKSYTYATSDPILIKYEDSLFKMFTSLLIDPEKTATYQMLMTFKPYHVQLIAYAKYQMTYNSKLNGTLIDDTSQFVIHDWPTSTLSVSDDYYMSRSIETGYFEFDNTNIVKTDVDGASAFTIGDKIYSRDIRTNVFRTESAVQIVDIQPIGEDIYGIELEDNYSGIIGVFTRAYKYYAPLTHEEVDLAGAGYFSFTTVGNANEVHTTEEGFMRFSVGDWIYAPVDNREDAVRIIAKDFDTYSFILKEDYNGTDGSWDKAIKWRPAP